MSADNFRRFLENSREFTQIVGGQNVKIRPTKRLELCIFLIFSLEQIGQNHGADHAKSWQWKCMKLPDLPEDAWCRLKSSICLHGKAWLCLKVPDSASCPESLRTLRNIHLWEWPQARGGVSRVSLMLQDLLSWVHHNRALPFVTFLCRLGYRREFPQWESVCPFEGRLIFYHYWCWRAEGAAPAKK